MADDIAKRDFSVILRNLNRKFDITDCKWTEDRFFEIKFRTNISIEHNDYNTYCDNWAGNFSHVTDTTWVHKISNTGPKVKFRKQYQCWTHEEKDVQKELLFDPRKCRATLDIKILGDTSPSVVKKNKYLRLGLNALIKINFQHLHSVDTTQNYAFFVHRCPAQDEPLLPIAKSKDNVSQLVAKMVENAAVTSQKAAERAEEVLRRQCIVNSKIIDQVVQPAVQIPEAITYQQENIHTVAQKYEDPPVTQVLVSSDGQSTETYYLHNLQQVVFDSTTQTIREINLPVTGDGISHLPEHQLVQVQMPPTHITQVIEVPHPVQNVEGQSIQHY